MLEPKADIADEIFDRVKFRLSSPQLGFVNLNFFMGDVQEVLGASLVLCEQVTFGPHLLEELLLLLTSCAVAVSHVINLKILALPCT